MMAEIEGDLHAGIATSDDEHALPGVLLAGLVVAAMGDAAAELSQALEVRDHFLSVLAGGGHQPPPNVLDLGGPVAAGVYGGDTPQTAGFVEARGQDGLVEARGDVEVLGVGLQVLNELLSCRVLWIVHRERETRKLAELLGKVKL